MFQKKRQKKTVREYDLLEARFFMKASDMPLDDEDEEVNEASERVVQVLQERFHGELR